MATFLTICGNIKMQMAKLLASL